MLCQDFFTGLPVRPSYKFSVVGGENGLPWEGRNEGLVPRNDVLTNGFIGFSLAQTLARILFVPRLRPAPQETQKALRTWRKLFALFEASQWGPWIGINGQLAAYFSKPLSFIQYDISVYCKLAQWRVTDPLTFYTRRTTIIFGISSYVKLVTLYCQAIFWETEGFGERCVKIMQLVSWLELMINLYFFTLS